MFLAIWGWRRVMGVKYNLSNCSADRVTEVGIVASFSWKEPLVSSYWLASLFILGVLELILCGTWVQRGIV